MSEYIERFRAYRNEHQCSMVEAKAAIDKEDRKRVLGEIRQDLICWQNRPFTDARSKELLYNAVSKLTRLIEDIHDLA